MQSYHDTTRRRRSSAALSSNAAVNSTMSPGGTRSRMDISSPELVYSSALDKFSIIPIHKNNVVSLRTVSMENRYENDGANDNQDFGDDYNITSSGQKRNSVISKIYNSIRSIKSIRSASHHSSSARSSSSNMPQVPFEKYQLPPESPRPLSRSTITTTTTNTNPYEIFEPPTILHGDHYLGNLTNRSGRYYCQTKRSSSPLPGSSMDNNMTVTSLNSITIHALPPPPRRGRIKDVFSSVTFTKPPTDTLPPDPTPPVALAAENDFSNHNPPTAEAREPKHAKQRVTSFSEFGILNSFSPRRQSMMSAVSNRSRSLKYPADSIDSRASKKSGGGSWRNINRRRSVGGIRLDVEA
ncbi:hypothetical protein SeMB42_g02318 [Synchytrium endobioticum]|uniref:Uncharacterized protein n=1 Tax=Synchytrium endobioticum TaxID=286115 RepID=A0A507DFV3_9FUNG|nr:hypothetical protein SeLEV6574_g03111 [Synchytrium endobioticum]TPX50225.1 hypothetical protein SeMB42_g02318 [Synchytrium endobioticum]